ncbi:unnamed protein product [Paramecium pentaurelia]|uniref:Uncharacterized protein n=1 Tax=Paramecium pentaurelia TaxID=43138 RepID=A0A8S1Y4A0_9CILI|nr:unnamed protein product [Paramecium pentaurelia]
MQYLFIIFGFHILQIYSKSKTCEIQQIQNKITCHEYILNCFLLEGNEEDYYQLKSIDKQIIQKSFTIPYKNIPISYNIFNTLDYGKLQEKMMCSLFLNSNYYITCMNFDTLNYEKLNSNLQERIKIETTISSQEICEEIYQLDENFILLCFSQFNLKQYSVSLLGETILLLEYDVYFQVKDQCKKKIQKVVGKNQFRIAFFQCSLWKIILINHQEIVIILESKMNEGNPQLKEFFKIDDVQYCEGGKSSKSLGIQSLYIIEGNNYLQLRWESNQKITQELFKSENQILKLILLQTCQNVMLITFQEENNQQPFQKLDNEIVLNQAFEVEQIHFFYNFLFLQNSTELIIRIDKHLIQKYEILNTKLIYMESYNLFYQIDKTKELVIFYRYFPISAFLQPTQKFVYFIQLFDGFEKQYMMCIKIQYEKTLDKKTPELINLQIEKDCSQNQKTILSIIDFQSFQQMPFSLYNNYTNGVINLSIWNEGEQENLCYYQLRMYNFKGKIQLKSMYTFTHVVFQVEDSIYFHDCQLKKIQLILNTHQYEVFQNQEYYFLIDKNKKQIRMIYIFSGITQQIVTHSNIEIISAQQIGEQIIIYIKNQQSPILISKKILEKIQNNYLSQKLKQPGEILYYQEIKSYKFIQYQNIFAFEQNEEVRCFQFSDVQIVQIKIYVKAHFMIFAVQIQTNSILLYHFDQFEIHQFHNYTLEDYSFSSPLRYFNCEKLIFLHNFIEFYSFQNQLDGYQRN